MRTVDFAFRILRGGAFFGWLQAPADATPVIRMDEGAEIKTSLSGVFLPTVVSSDGDALEPNWLADEIQPVLIIDGVEHNLGVFAASSVTPVERDGVRTMEIEAFDRCWKVRDTTTEDLVYFPAGTNYLNAVDSLLTGAGISAEFATPTDATLAEDREGWEIGTSYLTIVNQLLAEINYNPLWFNSDGTAILEPASVPTTGNIEHLLSDAPDVPGEEPVERMLPAISRQTDVYNAPNVFVVVCANPEKTADMIAVSENDTPESPLSTHRRGRRISQLTRLDNIADQDALQAYADRQRDLSLIRGESINVETALLPGYGVNDVVGLRYGELSAVCIDRSWSMDLKVGGLMRHRLERLVYHLE